MRFDAFILNILLFANAMLSAAEFVPPPRHSLWLRADREMEIDATGRVVRWGDQSGFGNDAFSADGASAPVVKTNAINGRTALEFDGAASFLRVADSRYLQMGGELTIFAVVNLAQSTGENPILSKTKDGLAAPLQFSLREGRMNLELGNGVSSATVTGSTILGSSVPHLLDITVRNAGIWEIADGNPEARESFLFNTADGGGDLEIGRAGTAFLEGEIAELFVFYGQLSPSERKEVIAYLGAKYFPVEVTKQPKDVSAVPPFPVSFVTAAHAGPASVQYQWQQKQDGAGAVDFEDLPGQTNATCSLGITLADAGTVTGRLYRAKFLWQDETLGFSDAARLGWTIVDGASAISASIVPFSTNKIDVTFVGYLDQFKAQDLSKYSIDQGVQVLAVKVDPEQNYLELLTSGLDELKSYTITYGYLSGFPIPNADQVKSTIVLPAWDPNLSMSFEQGIDGSIKVVAKWQELVKPRSLEAADRLNAAVWTPVGTNPIRAFDGGASVTVSSTNSAKFFRLR